jgi:hypothetical protein
MVLVKQSKKVYWKLGNGNRFKTLSSTVEQSYEKKWLSPKKAKAIGNAVATKVWVTKYWQKKMTNRAIKGKKK